MKINFEANDISGPFFPSKPIDRNHLDMAVISFVELMEVEADYPKPVYLRDIRSIEITETAYRGSCIGLRFTTIDWCWSVNWLTTKTGKRMIEAFKSQESFIRHLIFITPNLKRIEIRTPEKNYYTPRHSDAQITYADRSKMMQVIAELNLDITQNG